MAHYKLYSLTYLFYSYFIENFIENRSVHLHDTKNKSDLHFNSVQTAIGKRSVTFKGCKLWNNLPLELKKIKSTKTFKTQLKAYYFTQL